MQHCNKMRGTKIRGLHNTKDIGKPRPRVSALSFRVERSGIEESSHQNTAKQENSVQIPRLRSG